MDVFVASASASVAYTCAGASFTVERTFPSSFSTALAPIRRSAFLLRRPTLTAATSARPSALRVPHSLVPQGRWTPSNLSRLIEAEG